MKFQVHYAHKFMRYSLKSCLHLGNDVILVKVCVAYYSVPKII